MKKNSILSLAAGLLMSCSVNFAFAQANNDLPAISAEAQQDADAYLATVKTNDEKQISASLKNIMKKYKKDDTAFLAIANYYFKNKNYNEAIPFAKAAYEKNDKSIEAILLEGDCYYAQKKYGEASTKYEEAILANRADKRAYFKLVGVYKFINPQLALEYMETIKISYPDDPNIDKTMASIYYHQNDTAKAGASYKKYFTNVKLVDDVEASTEYAIVLFLNKDYLGSYDVVNAILPKDPKEISLNRMKFYDLIELKKFGEAAEASKTFFGQYPDSLYNFSDYKYEGQLQSAMNNIDAAVAAYSKASEKAPEEKKADLLKDLSKAYENAGKYDEAADTYQKYIDKAAPGSLIELYNKGRIYYVAVSDTSITEDQKKHFIEAGDVAFKEVAAKDDSYLGPFWSARLNSTLDPNMPNEVSMTQYTEALKRLESKDESYNSRRVECLRYITFYYFKKSDYDNSLVYAEKVLELSPDDSLASQIKAALAPTKKK